MTEHHGAKRRLTSRPKGPILKSLLPRGVGDDLTVTLHARDDGRVVVTLERHDRKEEHPSDWRIQKVR